MEIIMLDVVTSSDASVITYHFGIGLIHVQQPIYSVPSDKSVVLEGAVIGGGLRRLPDSALPVIAASNTAPPISVLVPHPNWPK